MSKNGSSPVSKNAPRVLLVSTQTWLQTGWLAEHLHASGCSLSAISPEESPLCFLPAVARRYRFHPLRPLASLRHAVEASRAEYVVPSDDLSVWLLYDLALLSPALLSIVERSLGSAKHFPTLSSRGQLLSLATDLGISVARTEVIQSAADLRRWAETGRFPFVLKKDGTWGGQGVQMVAGAEQLGAAYLGLDGSRSTRARLEDWLRNGNGAAFAQPRSQRKSEVLAQAFVDGVPANSMYACRNGRILAEVQARVVATRGATGPSIVIELMEDQRISQAGERLAHALQLSGFFGLDFMLDRRTAEPFLIECNPRATKLGHVRVHGTSLGAQMASCWAGHLSQPMAATPGESIWFYPDGMRLTNGGAGLPPMRSDVPQEQARALELRMQQDASRRVRARRRFRSAMAAIRNAPMLGEGPKAVYFSRPAVTDSADDASSSQGVSAIMRPGKSA